MLTSINDLVLILHGKIRSELVIIGAFALFRRPARPGHGYWWSFSTKDLYSEFCRNSKKWVDVVAAAAAADES